MVENLRKEIIKLTKEQLESQRYSATEHEKVEKLPRTTKFENGEICVMGTNENMEMMDKNIKTEVAKMFG